MAYLLEKKYKRYVQMGQEGRKNCLVTGMNKSSAYPKTAAVFVTGACAPIIHSEKIFRVTSKRYCRSNRLHLCLLRDRIELAMENEVSSFATCSVAG
jgi:hypothetical protein